MSARPAPVDCPACSSQFLGVAALARHLVEEAERSEGGHVMWLNRHVTKHRMSPEELQERLEAQRGGGRSPDDRVAR